MVFTEEADAPTGPYAVTCCLRDKAGKRLEEDAGKGRVGVRLGVCGRAYTARDQSVCVCVFLML